MPVDFEDGICADQQASLIEADGISDTEGILVEVGDEQPQRDLIGGVKLERRFAAEALDDAGSKDAARIDLGMVSRLGASRAPALIWPEEGHLRDEHPNLASTLLASVRLRLHILLQVCLALHTRA